MVGPGDVDSELEPEVKDECNTKYGDVVSVVIHEAFGTSPEDAVRIFVEFKRIESAIKGMTWNRTVGSIVIGFLCSCCRFEWTFLWRETSASRVL